MFRALTFHFHVAHFLSFFSKSIKSNSKYHSSIDSNEIENKCENLSSRSLQKLSDGRTRGAEEGVAPIVSMSPTTCDFGGEDDFSDKVQQRFAWKCTRLRSLQRRSDQRHLQWWFHTAADGFVVTIRLHRCLCFIPHSGFFALDISFEG